ncbi:MAG: hypothetical protein COB36_01895 [Alphaproteobacteria bacterium]|nr:MAG: hypothetical protein COB36_01895 [Alphaproteobacteria bacterium]
MIDALAKIIIKHHKSNTPLLVAINGIDCVGKTMLSDMIANYLREQEQSVIQISFDNFAKFRDKENGNPHVHQHNAASWYYKNAWDYEGLYQNVIKPIRAGALKIIPTLFSWQTDKPMKNDTIQIEENSIILIDGVFLLHPKLSATWDLKIFLSANLETVIERGIDRDSTTAEEAKLKRIEYEHCYYGGQRIYLNDINPEQLADIVIEYNDPTNPVILGKH